jgi:hypothetical protein
MSAFVFLKSAAESTICMMAWKLSIRGDEMNKDGRPLIEIKWEQVDEMCLIQCTGEEQAGILGIDYETLNRACKREKDLSFKEYYAQKSAGGKQSLRRRQYTTAMEGNPTMLVWLGKNWLGQTDRIEADVVNLPKLDITVVRDSE